MNQRKVTEMDVSSEEDDVDDDDVESEWAHDRLASFKARVLKGHKKGVTKIQFLQDESKIISGGKDGDIRLWHRSTGRHLMHLPKHHAIDVSSLGVTSDDKRVVTTSWDKTVKALDLERKTVLWTGRCNALVTSGDVSSDDKMIVTVADDDRMKIWDAKSGELIQEVEHLHQGRTILSVKWLVAGERVVTAGMDGDARVWDLKSRRTTATLKEHKSAIACMDVLEGGILATGSWDRSIMIWDVETGSYRHDGPRGFQHSHDGCVASVHFHKLGKVLLSSGYDKTLNIWDLNACNRKFYLKGHNQWINDAKISDDLNWIISASNDKTIRVWDLQQKELSVSPNQQPQSHGLELVNCEICEKPFSIVNEEVTICVFCRRNQKLLDSPPYTNKS